MINQQNWKITPIVVLKKRDKYMLEITLPLFSRKAFQKYKLRIGSEPFYAFCLSFLLLLNERFARVIGAPFQWNTQVVLSLYYFSLFLFPFLRIPQSPLGPKNSPFLLAYMWLVYLIIPPPLCTTTMIKCNLNCLFMTLTAFLWWGIYIYKFNFSYSI